MGLAREDVRKVSLLARLRFSEAELDRMTNDLAEIVAYVESLGELDTVSVEPLAHPLDLTNCLAEDVVAPSLARQDALAGGAKHDGEHFLVPPVL